MTNNSDESSASPALTEMVRKLDARKPGSEGYVTRVPELQRILKEITPLVSVVVTTGPNPSPEDTDTVPVEIKFSMHLSRAELREIQEAYEAAENKA